MIEQNWIWSISINILAEPIGSIQEPIMSSFGSNLFPVNQTIMKFLGWLEFHFTVLTKLVSCHLDISISGYNLNGAEGVQLEILKPFNFCCSINFGNLRVAKVSQYQAKIFRFTSFGLTELHKQLSWCFKPSVEFLILLNKY